jgi:hypothetical protein
VRGVGDGLIGELWQRALSATGQFGVDPVADARAAHDVQEPDVLIEVRSAEQPGARLFPTVDTAIVAEHGMRPDHRAERIHTERRPRIEEGEVDAGSLIRNESPCGDPLRRRAGAYAAAEYEVEELACRLGEPLKLDPEVADRVRFLPAGEHPRAQHVGLLAGGIDAAHIGFDEEGQHMFMAVDLPEPLTHRSSSRPPASSIVSSSGGASAGHPVGRPATSASSCFGCSLSACLRPRARRVREVRTGRDR